jgi:hypothetical protein
VLNDYLDSYVLKIERDEAVEIIRKCQSILAERPLHDRDQQEIIGRLRKILDGQKVAAVTAGSDDFLSRVS